MARRGQDALTLDLFEAPRAPDTSEGALNFALELRHVINQAIKKSSHTRYEIAARMSELLACDVTKHQLDSWTAESREGWRFPLEYVVAFEVAIESYALTELLTRLRGCSILVGEDAVLAELGRVERAKQELKTREKALKQRLRRKR